MHLLYLVARFAFLSGTAWCIAVCNGYSELCNRSYGNITYIGAHNSFAYSKSWLSLGRNQDVDLYTQLHLGVRLLQGQVHERNGELHFCHTDCVLFDGGTVENYLNIVNTFLLQSPDEVITLIFTNGDWLSLPDLWEPAFANSGIKDLAYVPPHLPMKQRDWPTLGDMIASGKRVVVFVDNGAENDVVNYMLPEFDMIWETPYSVTDASFPCSVDRTSGNLRTVDHMYMINHSLNDKFLGIIYPDKGAASTTNGVPSILANGNGCASLGGNRFPNFVLLDWVDIGNAFAAAKQMNGFS